MRIIWPGALDADDDRFMGELADEGRGSRNRRHLEDMDDTIAVAQPPEGKEYAYIDWQMPEPTETQRPSALVYPTHTHNR